MEKKIKVKVQEIFGVERFYPDCEFTKMLQEVFGFKTLTVGHLSRFVAHGFEIERRKMTGSE